MTVKVNDILTVEDDTDNILIKNVNQDKDIIFNVNDGGVDSEAIRIKGSNKYIGINENDPEFQLHISNDGANASMVMERVDTGVRNFISATNLYAQFGSVTAHATRILTNASPRLTIDENGLVFFPALGMLTGQADVQYNTTTKELGYVSSSERYKENITDVVNTDFAKNLTVKEFEYKGDDNTKRIGLIAEEVAQIYPQCVGYSLFKDLDMSKLDAKYKNLKDYFNIEPEVVTSATLYYDIENENGEVTEMSDTFNIIKKPDTVSYVTLVPILLDRIQKLEARVDILEAN